MNLLENDELMNETLTSQEWLKMKAAIKLDLINSLDDIKSRIDLNVQELLWYDYSMTNAEIDYIHKLNNTMIDCVEQVFNENMKDLDGFFAAFKGSRSLKSGSENFNEIKRLALKSSCFYFCRDCLNEWEMKVYPVGVLIVCDWQVNQNQLNYLRIRLQNSKNLNGIKYNFDENVLNIKYILDDIKNRKDHFESNPIRLKQTKIVNQLSAFNELKLSIEFEENLRLSKISANLFQNCSNLTSLHFFCEDSDIYMLEKDCFTSLNKLKILNLNGIKLNPSNMLEILKNHKDLEKLSLNGSALTFIRKNSFKNLVNLKELDMAFNQLTHLHRSSFEGLDKLEFLNLSQNDIHLVEEKCFKQLITLKCLKLADNCGLREIRDGCFDGLVNLEVCDLSRNNLQDLDSNVFSYFKNLKNLNLSYNQNIRLTNVLFDDLRNLLILNLSYCDLNHLETNQFGKLCNLRELDLSGNNFKIIQANQSFLGLYKLVYLKLAECKIEVLEENCFDGLNGLRKLDISRNSNMYSRKFDKLDEFVNKFGNNNCLRNLKNLMQD